MSDALYPALFEAAPDAMIVVDETGTMVLANTQAVRLFGYSRAELLGQKVELLVPRRFGSSHPRHRDGYAEHSRVREMGSGLELYALRKDGSEFPCEISLSPLDTAEGPLVATAIRDITERKAARARELQLSEIHHRVKNNLQIISSILKLHAAHMSTDEARRAFEDAEQRVHAIGLLHEALRDMQSKGPVDFEPYARTLADGVTRLALFDVAAAVRAPGVRLSLDQSLTCGLILNELLTNALKHAFGGPPPPEGVRRQIRVDAVQEGEVVRLEVSDNGAGFPDTARPDALGMHLVRTLLRQLGGSMRLESRGGAHVLISFPAADVERAT